MSESSSDITTSLGKALIVRLGEDLHAVPITRIEEVLPALRIESLPQCPDFVRGVVFVRGHLIPVLEAATRLGLKNYQRPDEPHIVCFRIGDRLVGIEFDEALDLIDVGDVQALDAETLGANTGFFAGVIEHEGEIIRLLNPEKLIGDAEVEELNRVPRTA